MDACWTIRRAVYRSLSLCLGLLLGAGLALGLAVVAQGQSGNAPLVGLPQATAPTPPDQPPLVDACRQHLWLVQPDTDGPVLLHSLLESDPPTAYQAGHLSQPILAIAADDDQLYLVKPAGKVVGIRYDPSPAPGQPHYQWTVHPPLPMSSRDRLVGLAAGRLSLFALLAGGDETTDRSDGRASLKLLRLTGERWQDIDLPEPRPADLPDDTVMLDRSDNRLALAWRDRTAGLMVIDELTDQGWHRRTWPIRSDQPIRLAGVMGRPVVVLQQPGPRWIVHLLLEDKPVALASPPPDRSTGRLLRPVVRGGMLELVCLDPDGRPLLWRIDPQAPADAPARLVRLDRRQRPPVELDISTLIMIGVVGLSTVILLANWKRQPAQNLIRLPETLLPCDLSRRLLATAIDLVPVILVCWWGFDLDHPLQVFEHWPGYASGPWQQVRVSISAIALFFVHTTLGELWTCRTLGKALTGCRVVDHTGRRPGAWPILARNIIKLLETMIPMLLVLVALSPYRQRLGDIISRTVVVRRRPLSPPAQPRQDRPD